MPETLTSGGSGRDGSLLLYASGGDEYPGSPIEGFDYDPKQHEMFEYKGETVFLVGVKATELAVYYQPDN